MSPCMIGMAHHVMTAAMSVIVRTVTTVLTATIAIAKNVAVIAAYAMKQPAWVVVASVRIARKWSARIVSANVLNVVAYAANNVLKKIYVQTVKKIRSSNMTMKTKTQEQRKTKNKANLKKENQKSNHLALRFSPTAWAKLLYFRDKSDNEVGGFAITEPDDLLSVIDFITVKQNVSAVSVKFDDEAIADLFDEQVDLGRKPEQFARAWLHTHPGDFAEPSMTDEETFQRVFGACQWAVMFILAQDNKTYAKLSFNVGPGGQMLIPVAVDYSFDFGPSNKEAWDAEYAANIKVGKFLSIAANDKEVTEDTNLDSYALPYDFLDEFEEMSPAERQFVLDELAAKPELWEEESEVMLL